MGAEQPQLPLEHTNRTVSCLETPIDNSLETLRRTHPLRRFLPAVSLLEQRATLCAHCAEYCPATSFAQYATAILHELREGKQRGKHGELVREVSALLAQQYDFVSIGQCYEIHDNEQQLAGELDVLAIKFTDHHAAYSYYEIKQTARTDAVRDAAKQVSRWAKSMHLALQVPYDRLDGYVVRPGPSPLIERVALV